MCTTYGVFELLLFRMGLELFPTTSISSSSDSEDVVREGSLLRFLPPFEAGLPVERASMTKAIFKSIAKVTWWIIRIFQKNTDSGVDVLVEFWAGGVDYVCKLGLSNRLETTESHQNKLKISFSWSEIVCSPLFAGTWKNLWLEYIVLPQSQNCNTLILWFSCPGQAWWHTGRYLNFETEQISCFHLINTNSFLAYKFMPTKFTQKKVLLTIWP